ncbi:MAG: hypothetical protein HC838_17315 [Spirulinaceae cyanobacterium RM2_2_10]|nr:hypothetical protein [Spirulinaceae cyanobacterium RM2_2_10]
MAIATSPIGAVPRDPDLIPAAETEAIFIESIEGPMSGSINHGEMIIMP